MVGVALGLVSVWLVGGALVAVTVSWDYYIRSLGITISEMIAALAVLIAVVQRLMTSRRVRRLYLNASDALITTYGGLVVLIWATHPDFSRATLRVILVWIVAILLYWVISRSIFPSVRRALVWMIWSAVLAGVVGFHQLATHNANDTFALVFSPENSMQNLVGTEVGRVRALFDSATEYASALAMFLPIWASLAWSERKFGRAKWLGAGAILVVALLGTATRGAWISVVVGILYVFWRLRTGRGLAFKIAITAVLGGVTYVMTVVANQYTALRWNATALTNSIGTRLHIYALAWQYIAVHPLGGGPLALTVVSSGFGDTENALLAIGVQFGIAGALLLGAFLVSTVAAAWTAEDAATVGMVGATLSLIVRSAGDPTIAVEPQILLLFVVIAGLMRRTVGGTPSDSSE
jgi:O-antigen ligase